MSTNKSTSSKKSKSRKKKKKNGTLIVCGGIVNTKNITGFFSVHTADIFAVDKGVC